MGIHTSSRKRVGTEKMSKEVKNYEKMTGRDTHGKAPLSTHTHTHNPPECDRSDSERHFRDLKSAKRFIDLIRCCWGNSGVITEICKLWLPEGKKQVNYFVPKPPT